MFFENFPIIAYDSVGNGEYKAVTDLLRRVAIRSKVRSNVLVFDTYDVKQGETPEMLADKLYNDPEFHWIILLINNITDRYHQWPMNYNQFLTYLNDKYSNVDATHHYEISQVSGDTTIKINIGSDNTEHSGASIVTNREFEEERQDELRKIRLLNPIYIEPFVAEYQKIMKESVS
jgi:hypothetical protein